MAGSFKAMIVVLAIAAVTFRLAKPIALKFSSEADFVRRQNLWILLTAVAFIAPNFWSFAVVAAPSLVWGGRRDTNPVAFYLLFLHLVPPVAVGIPKLFDMDMYRLLSFCILFPTVWRLRITNESRRIRGTAITDILLLCYGVLQIAIYIPPDSPDRSFLQDSVTNALRRGVLFFTDTYVLYYAVSRSCSNRRAVTDALAAFCLSSGIMAALAVFEALRGWLLYADVATSWSGNPSAGFYLLRGGEVRAQASAGQPLALGYLLSTAFGFWLYLKSQVPRRLIRVVVILLLWSGLLAAYSRGPWAGALFTYFAFIGLGPRALPRFLRATVFLALISGVILVSPIGERIIQVLPFMGGSIDTGSLMYRQQIAQRSWELIQNHPFLGDSLALLKMQDLRQGGGIIDLLNTYAQVALFYGLTGLFLFLSPMLIGLARSYRLLKAVRESDPDLAQLGLALVACVLGTLLMIVSCSFNLGYQKLFYVLVGLAAAYPHCDYRSQQKSVLKSAAGTAGEEPNDPDPHRPTTLR